MTVFIKRYPSNGELPIKEGRYIVSNGNTWFEAFYCKEFSFHEEFKDCSGVDVWLEEVELPSEEDVHKEAFTYYGNAPGTRSLNIFKHGAIFILNKLKGE